MNKKDSISVIILTFNEEKHIERCIASTIGMATDVFVVDCYSTDKTLELAETLGAKVYQNKWVSHANQFNWALNNLPITTNWVLRLDADEIVTDSFRRDALEKIYQLPENISGIYIGRRVHFMGRWIRHGAVYPMYVLRLFKYGKGKCELRWMDEHINISEGNIVTLDCDIIDDNRNNLEWWTTKHNHYALREAIDMLNMKYRMIDEDGIVPRLMGSQTQRKRWFKIKYASLPLFVRPFFYFMFRYFFRLGFLDGTQGLIWHFLQGFWYRFLVDAIIFEIYLKGGTDCDSIKRVIGREYGINLVDGTKE